MPGDYLNRQAPCLETDRLILRGHRRDDLDACAAMWADPIVTRYIGGRPFTREEVWSRLLRYIGHWALLGYGYWAMEEKSGGLFVGELGFADFKRQITPSLDGMPELGWALLPKFHRKGLATEAIHAALAWGEEQLAAAETACLIHPDNLASVRVATKCGYLEIGRTIYKDQPTVLFSRPNGPAAT